jgi:hypothetical protein
LNSLCGRDVLNVANGCQMAFFVACCFLTASTQSVSCFLLKPLHSTLFWPPCAFLLSLTSSWTELRPLWTRFAQRCGERRNSGALILVEGVTENRHMCRFFVTPWNQSVSWNGAKHTTVASTAPFVPIQDFIHPSLLWLSLLYH